jgi:hypothetical protein
MHLQLFTLPVQLADVSAVENTMHGVIDPIVTSLCVLASLACVVFLVIGGFRYITSSGRPDKLGEAKHIIQKALIGLVVVLAAATLTAVLTHAYSGSANTSTQQIPQLQAIQPNHTGISLVDVIIKAITGVLQNIIASIASPFMNALSYFTSGTPLMAADSSVFNLWLATVAIADVLFVLVVAMLGFNIMSASVFGLDEIEFKHLLPQLGLIFLLINSSIFAIDAIISLSNGMIAAIHAGFGDITVWKALESVVEQSGGLGIAALVIMVILVSLSFILLIYYVGRLVTLYLGAVLAPLILLLWLLPSFKDFASNAAKTYLTTIFVLFVHVVILELAASIFAALVTNSSGQPDPIMALVVGTSTMVALLKTQGVMMQMSYANIGTRSIRRLGGQFINGISHLTSLSERAKETIDPPSAVPLGD